MISEKFILTAAHCTWLSLDRNYDVSNNTPEVVRFGVENIEDNEVVSTLLCRVLKIEAIYN